MDTVKTRAQVVQFALDELFATSSGNDAEAEDIAFVDSKFDGLLQELDARGVVYIANEDEIPAAIANPLSELLASECAARFGQTRKSPGEIIMIEDRIKTMLQRQPATNKTLQFENALRPRRLRGVFNFTRGY